MKYIKIAICILLFLFGLALGIIIKDYPVLTLNKEVKIYEVLNLILTATIAILIPFFIKKWIDDNRQIKNDLINELKNILQEAERIKEKIKNCYVNKAIHKSDKDEINFLFDNLDYKFNSLEQQLIASYDTETKTTREELKNEHINYWKLVTGVELFSSKTKTISENFYHSHNKSYAKFETLLKKTINKIYRL